MNKNLILLWLTCLMFISASTFSQIIKIDVDANPDGICEGETDTLRVLVTAGVDQPRLIRYKWTADPPTQFFPDDSYPTVRVKPSVKTTFTVTVTNVDIPANEFSRSISVTVTQRPLAFAGVDTILCLNTSYIMDPDVLYGTIFKWTTPNGKGTYDNDTKLRAKYTPAPGETGWIKHILTVEDYEYCHQVKDSMVLGYVEPPYVSIQPPVKQNICLDTKYLLTVDTKNNPAVKVKWRKESGYGKIENSESTTMTYVPDPFDRGVVLFIVDAWYGGCHSADSITVPVAPIYFDYIPPSLEFCMGQTEYLCVSPCAGCNYKWSTGETTSCIKLTPTQNSTLMLEMTNMEGCYRKDTVEITVLPSPPVPKIAEDKTEKIITITPEEMELYSFIIKGNKVQEGLNNEFAYREYISVADTILISITNDVGCSSDTIFKIPKMICVDAFSPNGDGINDLLLPGRKITVFDRTQKILYQGWDGWDGRLSGREMPEGTYFYILFNEDNSVFCKTPVTLLRSSQAK